MYSLNITRFDPGGGGCTSLYIWFVPPHPVGFIHFDYFGLESGMVFKKLSFQFQINKSEIEIREFEMHLKNRWFSCNLGRHR